MKVACVVAAAGASRRMGHNKLFLDIGRQCVLKRTVSKVLSVKDIDEVIVCVPPGRVDEYREAVDLVDDRLCYVDGGSTRQESVYAGLQACRDSGVDKVLIHDGARPLVSGKTITDVINALHQAQAVTVGLPVADTLKRIDGDKVLSTVDRVGVWSVQTPQGFSLDVILRAHKWAQEHDVIGTDDASLVEQMGLQVVVVRGERMNFKLTEPADVDMAGKIVSGGNVRMGMGFDAHKLVSGRDLVLGGVKIPYEMGLDGHSDADAVCHAIADALLGAAGLADIGVHFPDNDPEFKDADSLVLLSVVVGECGNAGYGVGNVDVTILADEPRIAPYADEMRRKLADVLNVSVDAVSIKATRTEGVVKIERGICVWAVAVLCGE